MSARERRYIDPDPATSWTNAATQALKLAAYDVWAEEACGIEPPERADVAATAAWLEEQYKLAQQRLKERHDDSDRNRTVHA